MLLPTIRGVIDRRILVNYRVDPEVAARLLPAPFRPKLADGHAMAGICLIRLKQLRPSFVPLPLGIGVGERGAPVRRGVGPRRDSARRGVHTAAGHQFAPEHPCRRAHLPGSSPSRALRGERVEGSAACRVRERRPPRVRERGGAPRRRAPRGFGVRFARGGVALLPARVSGVLRDARPGAI